MPNRRETLFGIASALALGPTRKVLGFAAESAAPLPVLGGVEFVSGSTVEGKRLAMAFNRETWKVPALRAVCTTTEGVAEAVKWARATKQGFAVHSSGHCFDGHSMHPELVIGTSRLNQIAHDVNARRVTVGAGAFIGHVHEKLASSRQGLAGGTYGSVCVAGLTLGGGIGHRARSDGLLCDQLESITLVDAEGRIVRADREQNSDLFWASRGGGGGNFGIATEMTFRTVPVPERTIIYVFIAVPLEQAVRIVHDWPHWTHEIGRETTSHLLLSRHAKGLYLVALTGETTLSLVAAGRALRRLLGPENPIHDSYLSDYYAPRGAALLGTWDETVVPVDFLSKSDYAAAPAPKAAIEEVLDILERHQPAAVKLTFEALGGAVADLAPDATAYPHRAAPYIIEYRSEFTTPDQRRTFVKTMDEVRSVLKPFSSGGAYVNYPFADLDNWAEAYWGHNLSRLVEIKRKWDPENLFRHTQSVPVK